MNPIQQRIAIAKAHGMEVVSDGITHYLTPCTLDGVRHPDGKGLTCVPNYLNDLNAIAQVFAGLPYHQQTQVVEHLVMSKPSSRPGMAVAYSTAEDWCEAILRTLNLWTES